MATNAPIAPAQILRRRDKRRQPEELIQDPFRVVALAIRCEETKNNAIELLQAPLESSHLYDPDIFWPSYEFLQRTTSPPSRIAPRDRPRDNRATLDVPLTPIILSGLLHALELQQQQQQLKNNQGQEDVSSKLLMYCQVMRKAALQRVRLRQKRRHVQKIVLPVLCSAVLLFLYLWSVRDRLAVLQEWGFVGSCGNQTYADDCRAIETLLWLKYRDSLFMLPPTSTEWNSVNQWITADRYVEAPFALHSKLIRDVITMEELENGRQRRFVSPKHPPSSLQWLGDTTINQLVSKELSSRLWKSPKNVPTILDVGCGVGGTLFALLKDNDEQKLNYHGLAISRVETTLFHRLVEYHRPDLPSIHAETRSFDEILDVQQFYDAIIAIESLSHSTNLNATISSLMRSLRSGGAFVIVDEMWYDHPSRLSALDWENVLLDGGCDLQVKRELTLEYEWVPDTSSSGNVEFFWAEHVLGRWYPAAARMIQMQKDRRMLEMEQQTRHEAYDRGDLAYVMYVCVKEN